MPDPVKLTIVYYSSTGTLTTMADRLAATGESLGAEVRLRRAAETAPPEAIASNPAWQAHHDATRERPIAEGEDLVWADAVLFGSPTRYGSLSSQLQGFIDTLGPLWGQGKLADKAYAGFTASQTAHGGQESTLLSLYHVVHHLGGIVVAPGYTDPLKFVDGNPYGVSHATGADNDLPLGEPQTQALDHLVTRLVRVADRLRREPAAD